MVEATENVVVVARELRRLALADAVFVGGATIGLHLTDPAAGAPRVTRDVDVVVDVASRKAFYDIEVRLRDAGHTPDPDGPVGRWWVHGIPVDLTPATGDALGFTNRWYRMLVDTAPVVVIEPDLAIRLATPPMFLTAKLEAFLDRGVVDPLLSKDLTDIVLLVNGRSSIVDEVEHLPPEARSFVQRVVSDLLADPEFTFTVHAHLPPDDASQGRTDFVMAQLRRLAST